MLPVDETNYVEYGLVGIVYSRRFNWGRMKTTDKFGYANNNIKILDSFDKEPLTKNKCFWENQF
jgi:hypothetical protein